MNSDKLTSYAKPLHTSVFYTFQKYDTLKHSCANNMELAFSMNVNEQLALEYTLNMRIHIKVSSNSVTGHLMPRSLGCVCFHIQVLVKKNCCNVLLMINHTNSLLELEIKKELMLSFTIFLKQQWINKLKEIY